MKITNYLYNAFLIEENGAKVAIDPGQNLWIFRLESLVPRSEWSTITHVVITHGDPDHHWQSDRVAKASGAHVICGKDLTRAHSTWTMDVDEALEAVALISATHVILCHYSVPFFWKRRFAVAVTSGSSGRWSGWARRARF